MMFIIELVQHQNQCFLEVAADYLQMIEKLLQKYYHLVTIVIDFAAKILHQNCWMKY